MRLLITAGLGFALAIAGCASNGTTTVDEKKVTEAAPPMDPGGVAIRPVEPYRPSEPMPAPAPAPAPSPSPEIIAPAPDAGVPVTPGRTTTYTVQKGDTLYSIAGKVYGFTTAHDKNTGANKIFEANKTAMGADRDRLKAGMKLNIPVKPDSRVSAAAPKTSKASSATVRR